MYIQHTMSTPEALTVEEARQAGSCACFNLRKTVRVVTQLYDDALRAVGLRATQFTLLNVIYARQPVTVNQLADAVLTDRTTLTRNLKPLERDGLLTIQPGSDRRVREVAITEKGKETLAAAHPLWREVQSRVSDGLGDQRLTRLLGDLAATVEAARE